MKNIVEFNKVNSDSKILLEVVMTCLVMYLTKSKILFLIFNRKKKARLTIFQRYKTRNQKTKLKDRPFIYKHVYITQAKTKTYIKKHKQ